MHKMTIAAVLAALSGGAYAAPANYTIDPLHTFPHFTINHLGFSNLTGRFGKTTGKIVLDREAKIGSVDVVIDAASIDTGFQKRDDHLRSPDFLNVVEFPEITYRSTGVAFHEDGRATVDGQLTLMGVSKPVRLEVTSINCGINPMDPKKQKYECGFNATGKIKRSDFGVTFALPAIGDDMNLTLEVEAVRDEVEAAK